MIKRIPRAGTLTTVLVLALIAGAFAAPAAIANHPANTCLDVEPETDTNPAGTTHTVTATLRTTVNNNNCTGAAVQNTGSAVEISFELSGPGDTDNGDTPDTPDLQCTIGNNDTDCVVQFTSTTSGTTIIRGWIDHDRATPAQGGATEADLGETQAEIDADATDVVTKTWTGTAAGAATTLDCDDAVGPDTERETNPSLAGSASAEVYTCTALGANNQPAANVLVQGEVTGANDPDSPDSDSPETPDYSCTTGSNGTCQITVTQNESEVGTATICFWVGTAAQGNTLCNQEATGENQAQAGSDTGNDLADQVEKTWQARAASSIDVEPESATNQTGTNHVITVTVYDQFGTPLTGNTTVNFEFFDGSPNDASTPNAADRTCTTTNTASCTITITSTQAGTDLVCAWIGATPNLTGNNTNGQCGGEALTDADDAAGTQDAPEPSNDRIDVVQKTWSQPATTVSVTPAEDTNDPGTQHVLTATVTDAAGNVTQGTTVTWTISGQGTFVAQETTTDADGQAQAIITSAEVGN
ncbi:MAG: Ig-like domain-containing protein, partial [Actinomycetota bacterium]|nr:Ig-like domain-containing protein [Actinomycetota bacterium]